LGLEKCAEAQFGRVVDGVGLATLAGGVTVTAQTSSVADLQYRAKEIFMPTYIALLKWTQQGLQNIKQSPSRLEAARKGFEAAGVRMKDFYMITGQHDVLAILEAPDDVALAKAILASTSQGSITSETCRAYSEDEYRKIIAGLP